MNIEELNKMSTWKSASAEQIRLLSLHGISYNQSSQKEAAAMLEAAGLDPDGISSDEAARIKSERRKEAISFKEAASMLEAAGYYWEYHAEEDMDSFAAGLPDGNWLHRPDGSLVDVGPKAIPAAIAEIRK